MRPLLAFAIMLLGLSSAAPEPEFSSFFADYLRGDGSAVPSLVEIESSTGRADRLAVEALQPHQLTVEIFKPQDANRPLQLASASAEIPSDFAAGRNADAADTGIDTTDNTHGTEASLDELCNALFTSAQNNDLPIPFFANLIWQESRLRDDAVSKKGAMGIAQFMPEAAVENGLDDPFDPMQAIPASARFLHELRLQFGNLGFVAAAYNAGAHRVAEWLERRGSLPRETRTYVVRVTGLSADAWRKIRVDDVALTFVSHLPCRSLPAFASFEQEQSEEAQSEQTKLAQEVAQLDAAAHDADERAATRKHDHRHEARRATHDRHGAKREAAHRPRGAHEKHQSA
jgi:soluble lytic murein transglycosylase-like protein